MKKICIVGAGGAAINSIGEIAKDSDLRIKIKDKIQISYGFISPHLEEIHEAQSIGLNILVNKNYSSNKDIYKPIINRKIIRAINYLAIGETTGKGLPGQFIEETFEESEKYIDTFLKKLLKECNLVIFIAGFGGKTGTYLYD